MPDLADNINLSSQIDRIIWIAGKFARFSVQYDKNIRAKSQDIIIRANVPDLSVNI